MIDPLFERVDVEGEFYGIAAVLQGEQEAYNQQVRNGILAFEDDPSAYVDLAKATEKAINPNPSPKESIGMLIGGAIAAGGLYAVYTVLGTAAEAYYRSRPR